MSAATQLVRQRRQSGRVAGQEGHRRPRLGEATGQGLANTSRRRCDPHLPAGRFHVWLMVGFVAFFILEEFLHWHHCHRADHDDHRPLGHLILLADGLHNFICGLAVAGAFIVDIRVGIVTWLVAAMHEVPQELGDFTDATGYEAWFTSPIGAFVDHLECGALLWAVNDTAGGTMVDIGAGTGHFATVLAAHHQIIAVEPSPAMRDEGRRRAGNAPAMEVPQWTLTS